MRSASAIVSLATATRCCSSAIPRPAHSGNGARHQARPRAHREGADRRCYNRPMHFEVIARCGQARRGKLTLAHGTVETPVFMPVGTYGTVKAMAPDQLRSLPVAILLCNSSHLLFTPSHE